MRGKRNKLSVSPITMSILLPDELVIEILARLPTKCLHRFRCVSKLWTILISHVPSIRRTLLPISGLFFDVDFARAPLDQSFQPRFFFHLPMEQEQHQPRQGGGFQSGITRLPSTFHAIHSCNGLLLFTTTRASPTFYKRPILYIVWNPATTELVALPKLFSRLASGRYCFLAYDPLQSPHYKVVHFNFDYNVRLVEIYSSFTGKWDTFTSPPDPPLGWYPMSVFHKGALHMLSHMLSHDHLIHFHVDKGSFHTITLPRETTDDGTQCSCIGESRGHLLYAVTECSTQGQLRIYMLDEDNTTDKWLLLHKISTKVLAPRYKLFLDLRPIAFHPESEVVYLSIPRRILSFHPRSGRVEVVREVTEFENVAEWWEIFPIIPCLESIDPPGGKFINVSAI